MRERRLTRVDVSYAAFRDTRPVTHGVHVPLTRMTERGSATCPAADSEASNSLKLRDRWRHGGQLDPQSTGSPREMEPTVERMLDMSSAVEIKDA